MNRIKKALLILLKAPGYNDPDNWRFLFNQWLHQGYLWGWYSYDVYQSHVIDPRDRYIEIEDNKK